MDDPLLWATVAAAALSGFFSLNAYALRSPSRRDLEAVFAARSSRCLGALLDHQAELQMLCGLLRSVCNLAVLVMLMLVFEAGSHNGWGIIWAAGVAAVIIGVFAVAIPHAWARYRGPRILSVTAGVLLGLRRGLWPVVAAMRAFDLPVRRLSGAPEPVADDPNGDNGAREDAVKAEILQVASEAQAEGAVDPEEMEMIESVIEFGDQRASEIMTPRTDIVALPVDAAGETVRRTVIEAGHTRIPIYHGDIDNIVGVLHAKDLLAGTDPPRVDLRQIMRKPLFIPETKPLDDLLREFKARKSHMAIVLDEYGGTAGLVTVEDLIEEIVGDISDEYDEAESILMKRMDDGAVEVDGRMYIDDLNDALALALPEEEGYDTVAGYVSSELGVIPAAGETLAAHGAVFTVLAADDRRITRLRVQKASDADTSGK